MNNLNLDKYLTIINNEKIKRGLENYIPLYPMLRVDNNKLYISVMLTEEKDNVWNKDESVKPKYWILINIDDDNILEFNKTEEKDFVIGDINPKNINNKQQEISKYTVEKALQYKEYLINDIKNSELPLQKKLSTILGESIEIEGEVVSINDYLLANMEQEITEKINELLSIVIQSKYASITLYYDNLFKKVITEYKNNKYIDIENIKVCMEIMDNYYDGVIGISNLFNL